MSTFSPRKDRFAAGCGRVYSLMHLCRSAVSIYGEGVSIGLFFIPEGLFFQKENEHRVSERDALAIAVIWFK